MDIPRIHAALSFFRHSIAELGKRFERVRCWTPERVGLALIMLVANPSVTSIAKLMPAWSSALLLPTTPSDSTFIDARKKLAKLFPDAMRDLWQRLAAKALEMISLSRRTVGGLQWVAVDGSWVWLPHEAGIIKRWGNRKRRRAPCIIRRCCW